MSFNEMKTGLNYSHTKKHFNAWNSFDKEFVIYLCRWQTRGMSTLISCPRKHRWDKHREILTKLGMREPVHKIISIWLKKFPSDYQFIVFLTSVSFFKIIYQSILF